MSLLQEIRDLAVGDKGSIGVLLRKFLVLSDKLDNEALKSWVMKELNGYSGESDLPNYRVINISAHGDFYGPLGAYQRHRLLPPGVLKKEHQHWAMTARLSQSAAAYEHALSDKSGSVQIRWPSALVHVYQRKFIDGYALVSAWQDVPMSALVELVEAIRNRVLTFALELGRTAQEDDGLTGIPRDQVTQRVTNIFYGDNNVVATSARDSVQTVSFEASPGDLDGLRKRLESLGVKGEDLDGLDEAIGEPRETDSESVGPKTSSWIARTAQRVASQGGKITVEVATSVITQAIKSYLGLE